MRVDPAMKRVRLGIIGVGNMGRFHLRRLLAAHEREAEVVALADPDENEMARARELLDRRRCRTFSDYRDMLEMDGLDGVIICVPNHLHAEISVAALESGRHVLCEKPIATTLEDGQRMVEAARRAGRVLMIGFELRYSAYTRKLLEIVQGQLGRLVSMWCREFRPPFRPKVDDWIQDPRRSGGMLNEKMCHHFDVFNWIAGAPPVRVVAFGGRDVVSVIGTPDEVLDNAWVLIEYANGVRAMAGVCMFAPWMMARRHEFGFIGERGILEGDDDKHQAVLWIRDAQAEAARRRRGLVRRRERADSVTYRIAPDPADQGEWGFAEEQAEFIACVRDGHRPASDVRNVLDSLRVALAAERSVREGSIVSLA